MDISYFQKINNTYKSKSKQETELWLINRNEERWLYDNIDYQKCKKNDSPYGMLIIKGSSDYTKKIKALKSSPFNLGDYINWNNQVWLITSIDTDDKAHCSGSMMLCTYEISWQKTNGSIVSRWGYTQDFNKYNEGTASNGNLSVPSGSLGITVPIDNETRLLKYDMRFVIDIVTKQDYENGVIPEVYMLSGRKTVLNNNQYFNRGGVMTLTMTFDSFDAMKDHIVDYTDSTGTTKSVWVCNYNNSSPITPTPPPLPHSNFSATIIGSDETYFDDIGYWEVEFKDGNGAILSESQSPTDWSLQVVDKNNTIIDSCIIEKQGVEISLQVTDDSLLGESLYLQVILDDTVLAMKKIEVLGGF